MNLVTKEITMAKTRTTIIFEPGTVPNPSVCLLCGTYNRTKIICFPVTQPWNGALLICDICLTACVLENAALLGVVPVGEYNKVYETLEDMQKKAILQGAKLSNAEQAISSLKQGIEDAVTRFNVDLGTPSNNNFKPVNSGGSILEAIADL